MTKLWTAWLGLGVMLFALTLTSLPQQTAAEDLVSYRKLVEDSGMTIVMFGRDDCGFCK